MNTLFNNLTKQCVTIFLIHSIAATSYLHAMKPDASSLNNHITLINEYNEPTGLMSLAYTETERLHPSSTKTYLLKTNDVGMHHILDTAQKINCRITKHNIHDCPSLGICNPHTKKKITVQAIHSKNSSSLKMYYHPKRIVLTTNRDDFSFLQIYNASPNNRAILLATHDNDIITIKRGKSDDIRITINDKKINKDSDYVEY